MDYGQMKDMLKLQQDAEKVKKELENTHIEAESDGLVITISCDLKVIKVDFENPEVTKDQKRLESAIMIATNK
jgi:DNA-binding protein YbaB